MTDRYRAKGKQTPWEIDRVILLCSQVLRVMLPYYWHSICWRREHFRIVRTLQPICCLKADSSRVFSTTKGQGVPSKQKLKWKDTSIFKFERDWREQKLKRHRMLPQLAYENLNYWRRRSRK
ncbi:hypothetical protein RvY_04807 [Ramazzottius varieornatus]|uniref:Uncharacterized protein n=1 Tax=Ramazzottius varieornatus TaxID=947166 RepID=A0A1D1UZI2_RAMVA|nr:hypothetical protein RvY_04807 [Ramazzottius varieornatus]